MTKFKAAALLCLILLLAGLTACGSAGQDEPPSPSPTQTAPVQPTQTAAASEAMKLARAIVDSQSNREDYVVQASALDPAALEICLQLYGLERDGLRDAAVLYAGGVSPYEVAVLCLKEGGVTAEQAEEALKGYIRGRIASFTGYGPEQAAILKDAQVLVSRDGAAVAMLVCKEITPASRVFYDGVGGEAQPSDAPGEVEEPNDSFALAAVRGAAATQPNAADYTQELVFGGEGFAAYIASLGVDQTLLQDGAVIWAGDGTVDRIIVLCLRDDTGLSDEQQLELFEAVKDSLHDQGVVLSSVKIGEYETICSFPSTRSDLTDAVFYCALACQDPQKARQKVNRYASVFWTNYMDQPAPVGPTALSVARTAVDSQPNARDYTAALYYGEAEFAARVREYGLDPLFLSDGAVLCTPDGSGEIALLRSKSGFFFSTEDVYQPMRDYLRGKGFEPSLRSMGTYTFGKNSSVQLLTLFMCEDVDAAWTAFQSRKGEFDEGAQPSPEPQPSTGPELDENGWVVYHPPGQYNMTVYDTTAILTAWRGGDRTALSEGDGAILSAAEAALTKAVKPGMTDYEKELALHDWLVQTLSYDRDMFNDKERPDSLTPYGGLVEHSAACLGYATSFALLMDMVGIECRVVVGAAVNSTEDHAWNLVRLDGEWYAVDPTWDDPVTIGGGDYVLSWAVPQSALAHKYFNVTSDYMRQTEHQWAYRQYPEANGTKYAWRSNKH